MTTERRGKNISPPFDLRDDQSMAADIELLFAWQSGHRLVQREVSHGTDSAYPDSLHPALVGLSQWVSRQSHKFLDKPRNLLQDASLDKPASVSQSGSSKSLF